MKILLLFESFAKWTPSNTVNVHFQIPKLKPRLKIESNECLL